MTIYEVKALTQEDAPYFFNRDTLKFFGQTLKSFNVVRVEKNKPIYRVSAPSYCTIDGKRRRVGTTLRFYYNKKLYYEFEQADMQYNKEIGAICE